MEQRKDHPQYYAFYRVLKKSSHPQLLRIPGTFLKFVMNFPKYDHHLWDSGAFKHYKTPIAIGGVRRLM